MSPLVLSLSPGSDTLFPKDPHLWPTVQGCFSRPQVAFREIEPVVVDLPSSLAEVGMAEGSSQSAVSRGGTEGRWEGECRMGSRLKRPY